jgi:hypothetical protein
VYRRLKLGISIRKSVRIAIDEKFGTHEEVLVFVRTSWLRWLFFILGPMPQAIRLASFRGTLWTKFFGFSYLLPWILMEILGLISPRTVTQNPATTVNISFEFLDDACVHIAEFCYFYVLSPFAAGFATFVREKLQWRKSQGWDSLDWISIVLVYTLARLSVALRDRFIVRPLSLFCRKNIVMSQNLLVAFPEGEPETLNVDDDAVFWLVFFVGNLLLSLVGYLFLYDSSGTVDPGWTAVFG